MNDLLIFGIGVFVTTLVLSAVMILEWAAITSRDSAHQDLVSSITPRLDPVEEGFSLRDRSRQRSHRRAG